MGCDWRRDQLVPSGANRWNLRCQFACGINPISSTVEIGWDWNWLHESVGSVFFSFLLLSPLCRQRHLQPARENSSKSCELALSFPAHNWKGSVTWTSSTCNQMMIQFWGWKTQNNLISSRMTLISWWVSHSCSLIPQEANDLIHLSVLLSILLVSDFCVFVFRPLFSRVIKG